MVSAEKPTQRTPGLTQALWGFSKPQREQGWNSGDPGLVAQRPRQSLGTRTEAPVPPVCANTQVTAELQSACPGETLMRGGQ